MKVLVLGADGYLGWPTAMHFAARGHEVWAVDNYLRRTMALETSSEALFQNPDLSERSGIFKEIAGKDIQVRIGDLTDYDVMSSVFSDAKPNIVVHYAEQPSAPYSMLGRRQARVTLQNNLLVTLNCIWAVLEQAPDCHIVKLGTMGEYGTPNIEIEEGWIDIVHKGRTDKFLFPRSGGSLYHTTKILDTDLLWFYVRMHGLRVTDLMQGPVYGLSTDESELDERLLSNFHYDDIFGTVLNRFLVQAVAGVPLTVYGRGGQIRGYINLRDTLQCIELAARDPAAVGELRIFNQFTETFSVNELARRVEKVGKAMGLAVTTQRIANPRKEMEEHFYSPVHTGLKKLGLEPVLLTDQILADMLAMVGRYRGSINIARIMPRVRWSS